MNKLRANFNQKRARGLGNEGKGTAYRITIDYCEQEIRPILDLLHNKSTSEIIKKSLRKFLIITLVSTFEFYFKNKVRQYVNKNPVELTKLFKDELHIKLSDLDKMVNDKLLTKGNIVASSVHFDDLNQIKTFVSKLLDLDFFQYLYQENTKNKCKMMIKNGPPIDIDYKSLMEAFELRHVVVHEFSEVPYSYTRILKLWDNAMNIFDIANTVLSLPEDLKKFRLEYGRN